MKLTKATELLSILLAVSVIFAALPTTSYALDTGTEVIHIKTAEDLKALASIAVSENATRGKSFILDNDIELKAGEFYTIPIMGGTFDGANHTISGIISEAAAAEGGFFRRIGTSGTVKDLNISADFNTPDKTEKLGGIAGTNYGKISNCTFSGNIAGGSDIGGIVGVNEKSGTITASAASGSVTGFHRTGGIAGTNSGSISDCQSNVMVNTAYRIIEQAKTGENILSVETWLDVTDIGGIAGKNDGKLTGCKNGGDVGYIHVGYNIGGIAGRQSGSIHECSNSGKILGRRDVGGICGKLEPVGFWSTAESYAAKLEKQLDEVKSSIDGAIDEFENKADGTGERFNDIVDKLGNAEDSAHRMVNSVEDFVNSNVDEINELFSRISDASDEFSDALTELEAFSDGMSDGFDQIESSLKSLDEALDTARPALDEFSGAFDLISDASDEASRAMKKARSSISRLRESVGDREAVQTALVELSSALTSLSGALRDISDALAEIKPGTPSDDGDLIGEIRAYFENLRLTLSKIGNGLNKSATAVADMAEAFGTLTRELNIEKLDDALIALRDSFDGLSDAASDLSNASKAFSTGISEINSAGDALKDCTSKLEAASGIFSDSSDSLSEFVDKSSTILKKYTENKITFKDLGSEFTDSKETLKNDLDEMNKALTALESTVNDDTLSKRFSEVSDSLHDLTGILTDMLTELESVGEVHDNIADISESDKSAAGRDGTITASQNSGEVSGNTNIGGIVGGISLDLSFDRESTVGISQVISGSAKYLVSVHISDSANSGNINASSEYAGGIVGSGDFGVITGSVSSASVTSDGDYAGGIVGKLDGTVTGSGARAKVKGASYVGGIAGSVQNITECLSLSEIEFDGLYFGSIAGFTESDGRVRGNYYAGSVIGGVNGFDLSGECERSDFETITELSKFGNYFTEVAVTFTDEDGNKTVKTVPYGSKLSEVPEIADKELEKWKWDSYELPLTCDVEINGDYFSRSFTLTSGEEVPRIIVCGVFDENETLSVSPFTPETSKLLSKHTLIDSGRISGNGLEADKEYEVHLLAESGGELFIAGADNALVRHDYQEFGSYIVFELKSGEAFAYFESAPNYLPTVLAIALPSLALLLIVFLIIRKKRKLSGKKQA